MNLFLLVFTNSFWTTFAKSGHWHTFSASLQNCLNRSISDHRLSLLVRLWIFLLDTICHVTCEVSLIQPKDWSISCLLHFNSKDVFVTLMLLGYSKSPGLTGFAATECLMYRNETETLSNTVCKVFGFRENNYARGMRVQEESTPGQRHACRRPAEQRFCIAAKCRFIVRCLSEEETTRRLNPFTVPPYFTSVYYGALW